MTDEQRNQIWACIPKATRDELRELARTYNIGEFGFAQEVFGTNINSDTEPEPMLCVSEAKVRHVYERYHPYQRTPDQVVKDVLEVVFGIDTFNGKEE